jgi:hypothetical protein
VRHLLRANQIPLCFPILFSNLHQIVRSDKPSAEALPVDPGRFRALMLSAAYARLSGDLTVKSGSKR